MAGQGAGLFLQSMGSSIHGEFGLRTLTALFKSPVSHRKDIGPVGHRRHLAACVSPEYSTTAL